jgi:serine/threonine-protein kinase RsbW
VTADVGHGLTATARPQALDAVYELLETVWREHPDVAPEDRTLFGIAVVEIAGNIVEHAAAGADLDFRLDVRVYDDRLEARFRDEGVAFDSADAPAALPQDDLVESGRGLAMARAAVDEVGYLRSDGTNHWLVLRRRSA